MTGDAEYKGKRQILKIIASREAGRTNSATAPHARAAYMRVGPVTSGRPGRTEDIHARTSTREGSDDGHAPRMVSPDIRVSLFSWPHESKPLLLTKRP